VVGPDSIIAAYSGDAVYNPAISAPATVAVNAPFNLTSDSPSQSINPGETATFNVTLTAAAGFTGQVTLACTGAPAGATCSVSPNPATLSTTNTSVPLTVTVSNTASASLRPGALNNLSFLLAGIVAITVGLKRKTRQRLFLAFLLAGAIACGARKPAPPATIMNLTVTGTAGTNGATNNIALSLTVN
jgi:hypothetical protein